MSKHSDDPASIRKRSLRRCRRIFGLRHSGCMALAVLLAVGMPVAASAQSASPVSAECDAPPLPPGTPTTLEEMASPAAAPSSAATPATSVSTPAVEPAGTPADAAATERVTSAAENLIGCLSTGNALGFAALVTPTYLLTEFEITNPYDMEYVFEGFPTFELLAADDVQTHDDGRSSIVLTTLVGGTQVDRFRAYFVEGDGGALLLDQEVTLPVVGADVAVDVTLLDYSFELSQDTIPAGALVSFTISNEGQYPHEFAVVRLPEGVTVDDAMADPALAEAIVFIGGAYAEAGAVTHVALTNLEPGNYTVVCFVDVPEGVPHVARGMVAELTVE